MLNKILNKLLLNKAPIRFVGIKPLSYAFA